MNHLETHGATPSTVRIGLNSKTEKQGQFIEEEEAGYPIWISKHALNFNKCEKLVKL